MNRRTFLSLVPAIAVLPVFGEVAAHLPSRSLVQRKRIGPDAHEVTFTSSKRNVLAGPLQLRAKGNSLWIASVTWEDEGGNRYNQNIGKNLPVGQGMALPMVTNASNITFVITCLPLASEATMVELVGSS